MATIVSEEDLVRRVDCVAFQKSMEDKLNKLERLIIELPEKVFEKGDTRYVRKDIYELSIGAVVDELKGIRQERKDSDAGLRGRNWQVIMWLINIVALVVLGALNLK